MQSCFLYRDIIRLFKGNKGKMINMYSVAAYIPLVSQRTVVVMIAQHSVRLRKDKSVYLHNNQMMVDG